MNARNSSQNLLKVWEQGLGRSQSERAILLLENELEMSEDSEFLDMPLGTRDDRLIRLRAQLFGSGVHSVTRCPACQESIELNFSLWDIRGIESSASERSLTLHMDEWTVHFHSPTTRDILKLMNVESSQVAKQRLLASCIEKVMKNNFPVAIDRLPQEVVDRIQLRMEENDPYADRQIQVKCPACQHEDDLVFDITTFLWKELEGVALRLLRKVHLLAMTYGWSEQDILNMSPTRRDMYVELAEG